MLGPGAGVAAPIPKRAAALTHEETGRLDPQLAQAIVKGADEILAGYSWYPPLAGVPREQAVDAYAKEFFDRPHAELAEILEPEWLLDHDPSRAFIREHFAMPGAETTLDAALRLDSTIMLVDDPVKRVDNMTMAWGLEARVPFLDHELVELAMAVPRGEKIRDGVGKHVLKRAVNELLPDEIVWRPKQGFGTPVSEWFRGPLGDQLDDQLAARLGPRLLGLPDVGVRVRGGVVREAALTRAHRLQDVVLAGAAHVRDRPGARVPRGEDAEPPVAAEAELHRDGVPRLHLVHRRRVGPEAGVDGIQPGAEPGDAPRGRAAPARGSRQSESEYLRASRNPLVQASSSRAHTRRAGRSFECSCVNARPQFGGRPDPVTTNDSGVLPEPSSPRCRTAGEVDSAN